MSSSSDTGATKRYYFARVISFFFASLRLLLFFAIHPDRLAGCLV